MNDKQALKYAGFMGHLFVVLAGKPDERSTVAEVNTLDSAKQIAAEQQDQHPKIYKRSIHNKWVPILATAAILASLTGCFRSVRTEAGTPYACIAEDARDRGIAPGLKTGEKLTAESAFKLQHWPDGHFIQDPPTKYSTK